MTLIPLGIDSSSWKVSKSGDNDRVRVFGRTSKFRPILKPKLLENKNQPDTALVSPIADALARVKEINNKQNSTTEQNTDSVAVDMVPVDVRPKTKVKSPNQAINALARKRRGQSYKRAGGVKKSKKK
jgi:hypothetical protein